jgi:hypothetical protein
MRFYVAIDGETAGPFDHVQLLTLYRAGIIDEMTNCQKADQGGAWVSLSSAVPSVTLAATPATPRKGDQRVTVADLEMKFGSMMVFMVKWVFASIPAAIIVIILGSLLIAVLGGVFAGLLGGLHSAVK